MSRTKRPAAKPAPATLYKVVTAEGRAPFVPAYQWSLPTQAADGTWTPGAWHEEPRTDKCIEGLHLTPCPSYFRGHDGDHIVCAVEAEGVDGDPGTDSKVVATRVRLTRVVPGAEWRAEERRWESERHVRARAAEVKERLDAAREAAMQASRKLAAERAAGIDSPGLLAFKTLVELTPADSWVDVNGSRREALRYAVRRLRLNPTDIGTIQKDFRGSYWLDAEDLYSLAIEAGNNSACVALETFMGRKPWWKENYKGKRERVHVGSQVRVDGHWHTITSFRFDYLNAKREGEAKVHRITREMLAGKTSAEIGAAS